MPNMFATSQSISAAGGYVQSKLNFGTIDNPAISTMAYSRQLSPNPTPDNIFQTIGGSVLGAPTDVVDTVASMMPGVERGEVNSAIWGTIGMPGVGDWINNNRGSVEVASGILGAVIVGGAAEIATTKLLASGFMNAGRIGAFTAPLIRSVSAAKQAAAEATALAAAEGRTLSWSAGANLKFVGLKASAYAAKATVSEIAVTAALNKNSMIWTDDIAQNLLFGALGIGIGGLVGGISARGAVNRWANSDAVKLAFSDAADPFSFQRALTDIPLGGTAALNSAIPKESSVATAMLLDSRSDQSLAAQNPVIRNMVKSNEEAAAHDVIQTISSKGVTDMPQSKFALKGTSEGTHVIEAVHKDPAALYGLAEIGRIGANDTLTTALAERSKVLTEKSKSTTKTVLEDYRRRKAQTPLVLVNKTWMTVDDAMPFANYQPNRANFSTPKGTNQLVWENPTSGKRLVLSEDGSLNKDFDTLPMDDVLDTYEAMGKLIGKKLTLKEALILPAKPHYAQIDMAIEFERRGGVVDWKTHANINDVNSAKMKSLDLKADFLAARAKPITAQDRFRMNLPAMSAAERLTDPGGAGLLAVLKSSKDPAMTLERLSGIRRDSQRILGLTQEIKADGELTGEVWGFNKSQKGQWMAPVVGFFDDVQQAKWTRWDLMDSIAENQSIRFTILRGRKNAPLAKMVTEAILNSPGVQAAMRIVGLADSQIPGTGNAISAIGSQFVTQAMRFRHSEELTAAQNIRRVVNRVTEVHLDDVFRRLKPHVDNLSNVSGAQSRLLLNQYLSNTSGWDIAKEVVQADGTIGFQLAEDSVINQSRLGRAVNPDELVTNPHTGKLIVLDKMGNDARLAFEAEFKALLGERNAVRAARGLEPIKFRSFYTPPPKTPGKFVGFTLDGQNRAVVNGAIVADTYEEFTRRSEALRKTLPDGHRFLTRDEIASFDDMWELANRDFIDPTRMSAPGIGQRRGALSEATINSRALEDTMQYIKEGYEQNTNGVVRTIFGSQLTVAKIRSAAEVATFKAQAGVKNIFDTYIETLMGIPASANPRGITIATEKFDKVADTVIANMWHGGKVSAAWVHDVIAKMPGIKNLPKVNSFDDLANAMGPHTPFKDAMDYAEYTYGITPPPTVKGMSRHINRIAAGVILRWLEIPHAAMNMAGIITNMPGLISNKNMPLIGKVKGAPVVDSMQIMARGMKRMMMEKSGPDWEMMVRNGDTTQDVAELHQQLSLMKGKNGFMRFMTGDPSIPKAPATASAAEKSRNFLARKGVEGMASIMSDTSESLSRRWAHFVGLELADYHGIVGMESRHTFARGIANDAIANYDPLNRPEIFQSGFGSMYGLFMSYAQNYYQRMFRWLEDEQYAALGKSLGTQAAMFGFMGIPGSRQLAAFFGGEEDGTGLLDGIYERFGPLTGSVIANGGLNQITTLVGLPALALNTRGDANFRHPATDFLAKGGFPVPPGIEVLRDISNGVFQAVSQLVTPNVPESGRYAAEILARNMPNRMLHGALTVLAAGGTDTDVNGNVMSETQNIAETAFRFLGLRSARQQSEIEAYFMNQKALQIDAQRMDGVRTATRSLIRAGEYNRLPEVFDDYVNSGGKAWNFDNWIEGMIEESTKTRTQNQFLKAVRSPGMQALAHRISIFTGKY